MIITNLYIKVIDDTDRQLHSTWLITGMPEKQSIKESKMELGGLLAQDANDHLDNLAIQEDLEDSGYRVEHFDKKIPKDADLMVVGY